MSYCRLGCDGSDVYLYPDVKVIVCRWCRLNDAEPVRLLTLDATLAHIAAHREAGHTVPTGVEEEIRQDSKDCRIDWDQSD